ncbi:hypothetical protein B0T24DRAFT_296801 [Lasiosphaeria ovina]|uniref:Uncharacterized protein n=1 Tax=Lasiosphaeria ovina TaxID=92902 RepID=A0AAE0N8T5_9PEZI|nr:hypothetical protein B0T24DRAFT_296801 [Lasiosphaeria ovina]
MVGHSLLWVVSIPIDYSQSSTEHSLLSRDIDWRSCRPPPRPFPGFQETLSGSTAEYSQMPCNWPRGIPHRRITNEVTDRAIRSSRTIPPTRVRSTYAQMEGRVPGAIVGDICAVSGPACLRITRVCFVSACRPDRTGRRGGRAIHTSSVLRSDTDGKALSHEARRSGLQTLQRLVVRLLAPFDALHDPLTPLLMHDGCQPHYPVRS